MADVHQQLIAYLKDAHSLEQMSRQQLETATKEIEDPQLKEILSHHLDETREHDRLIGQRLEAHGESPSTLKDAAGRFAAVGKGMAAKAPSDTPGRIVRDGFVQEHAEIAAYEMLSRVAERAGDTETVEVARRILADERSAAQKLGGTWDRTVELSLQEAGATA